MSNYFDETITTQDIHDLRLEISKVTSKVKEAKDKIGRDKGGREIALSVTKLQEAKMWLGKVLEEMVSELLEEFKDEPTTNK